ncbi:MerR family transcriptional regulator [Microbacterium sp. SA39]|uniref:MerR family transcriptional regulator n=1 Tax=Microbacterium sp. SA39 TaxID=1263625 RepID=UPI0005FA027C|nr:MerR family transcriptional regulator [Microbacterium sp. SA39]KJQ54399.1 Mercuric resistance operon regulatory protein [Microbacterium sp. SA39]
MRISELSAQTGVTVPTIKYYLREGLLPEGERSAPTQAAYGEKHVERLRVIRALLDAGVSIAETRRVLAALDDPPESPHLRLGAAHAAITPPVDEALDLTEAERLVEGLGWKPGMCDPAVLTAVARALQGLEQAGFAVPEAAMAEYLVSMRRIADAEITGVPTESAEAAVRYVVLGSVLVEPLLLTLRRVAQQVSSGERFGGTD